MSIPTDLKYTKSHEWAKIEGDVATIGITDHAQSELGDIVFIQAPQVGQALESGTTFGSVESVKTVSDIYSPISGEVIEVNESLTTAPETVNSDPYGDGWLIKVKLSDPADQGALISSDEYQEVLDNA